MLKQEQLSRAKDGNKISKKGKGDAPSGTASPHATASPAGSAQATPSSSTQNLVDTKSRSSTSSDPASNNNNNNNPPPSQPDAEQQAPRQARHQFIPQGPHSGSSINNANPVTPGRFGGQPLPPSVVISPSAPVSVNKVRVACLLSDYSLAHSSSRCGRDHASRPCTTKSRPEIEPL